jgi:hypothetical protein
MDGFRMKFIYPYIYTSPRDLVHEEIGFDNELGVTFQETGGEHSIWAARIPFLPAMMSEDFTRLGVKRTHYIQERQFRFIYDLVRARENRTTFELRLISTPNPSPGQPNLVDIIFLGKVFSKRQRGGQPLAEKLWEKFISNFPLEDPFGYPIEPVVSETEFQQYYQPFVFNEFSSANLVEIRKYEDMPIRSTAPMGRVERKGDYIAHPFVPSEDFNPMGRFFVALAAQPQKCLAGISIRPTRMYDQEIYNVSFMIGQFGKTATEDDDVTEEYIRTRSRIGIYVYKKMMQAREQLVMVRVYLAGENEAPRGLAEALGSEMMGNAENTYPTMWTAVTPADDAEGDTALHNMKYLEHDFWGPTIATPPLARLRYLATPEEAYGAFRLPVPPESGYMPGVLVKNEPFVAPADELELREQARANQNDIQAESKQQVGQKKVSLGLIYHRGKATSGDFRLNVRDLTRHALIAGSTGSGKSTTIKHLLVQLWLNEHVPFLVLYPIDKPDYRELLGFPELAKDLLVFTLGDERTSPFRFNPFEVPDGLLLKTHLSRLMRVFMAAFSLQDPLPMIYREALRRVYRAKGWDALTEVGDCRREYPVMSEFYQAIQEITDGLQYGREVKDNVRQASVIRIADLLENAGHVVNVRRSMDLHVIMNQPTVMEIGRVGSTQDTTLLMGFLLMRFAEEVERHPRPLDLPHITVVEEAHRLMADSSSGFGQGDSRSVAGEDFANILAEVRGYGEGIIIAEQIPTLLVKGAVGNTYIKIMHWLEDAPSFDLFSNIMNLNEEQRDYARTLTPGFAIVRSPYGRPVQIKVPEFGDQPGFDASHQPDISDPAMHQFMQGQRMRLKLGDIIPEDWNASLASSTAESTPRMAASPLRVLPSAPPVPAAPAPAAAAQEPWLAPHSALAFLMVAPMKTCLFCRPLHQERACKYRQTVLARLEQDEPFKQKVQAWLAAALQAKAGAGVWSDLDALVAELEARLTRDTNPGGLVYCYFAQHVDAWQHDPAFEPQALALRKLGGDLLHRLDRRYNGPKR